MIQDERDFKNLQKKCYKAEIAFSELQKSAPENTNLLKVEYNCFSVAFTFKICITQYDFDILLPVLSNANKFLNVSITASNGEILVECY
jgi:hypothetical protein